MGATKTQITNLLEMRFDYQSARNVFNNWRRFAQIKEDPDPISDVQLVSLLEYLKANAPDATRVHAAVERLILTRDASMPCDHAAVEPQTSPMEAEIAGATVSHDHEIPAATAEQEEIAVTEEQVEEQVEETSNEPQDDNTNAAENSETESEPREGKKNKKRKH